MGYYLSMEKRGVTIHSLYSSGYNKQTGPFRSYPIMIAANELSLLFIKERMPIYQVGYMLFDLEVTTAHQISIL